MGLFSSSKSSVTNTTTTTNYTDSFNREYASNLQAQTGLSIAGDSNTLQGVDMFSLSDASGITLGRAGGSQIAFSAEQAKIAAGSVGGDFNFAEAGSILNSAILTKVSGGGSAGALSTGGSSSGGAISNWMIWAGIALTAFYIFWRK